MAKSQCDPIMIPYWMEINLCIVGRVHPWCPNSRLARGGNPYSYAGVVIWQMTVLWPQAVRTDFLSSLSRQLNAHPRLPLANLSEKCGLIKRCWLKDNEILARIVCSVPFTTPTNPLFREKYSAFMVTVNYVWTRGEQAKHHQQPVAHAGNDILCTAYGKHKPPTPLLPNGD